MAFASVSEWDVDAADNTEIDGISLAENVMRPPAVNNAFREMMSQIASYTRHGSDLSNSTGTLNLDSIDAMFLNITGTTTVTAATLTEGHSRRARAVSAFQLTASASLVVNGSTSSNYTTSAGDLLFFEGYGSSVVRVWAVTGGGSTTASTTEVLTGTNSAKAVTPDALAALWEKGSDEASAGTVAFGEGGYFHVTGTTTITDIDFDTAKDGRAVDVVFDGILTLTHNGTTLKLPGGANIVTAAGDRARFVQDSTDNVICLWYVRAGALNTGITLGTPVATTSGTTVASSAIPAWAKKVTVTLDGVSIDSTSTLLLQLSAGATFETTGYVSGGTTAGATVVSSTSGFSLLGGNNAAGDTHSGQIVLTLMNASTNTWTSTGILYETGTARVQMSAGVTSLDGPLDQVRLNSVSGTANFDAGSFNVVWE